MSVMMKSLIVLWEHRFALTLIVLAMAFLTITAGRQLQRYGDYKEVVRRQGDQNAQLVNWAISGERPVLLDQLPASDADRFVRLNTAEMTFAVSDPVCHPHRPRSFIGSRPHPTMCPHTLHAGEETNPSDYVCETAVSWSPRDQKKAVPEKETACLVTIWTPEKQGYRSVKATMFWPAHLSSGTDAEAEPSRLKSVQSASADH